MEFYDNNTCIFNRKLFSTFLKYKFIDLDKTIFRSSVLLTTSQGFNNHMWLVATTSDSEDREAF